MKEKERGILTDASGTVRGEIYKEEWRVIGRAASDRECVRIEHPAVSKAHARIKAQNGFFLQDLDSKNGTFVNGNRLQHGERRRIFDGDILRFACEEFQFRCSRGNLSLESFYGMRREFLHTVNGKKLCFHLTDQEVIDYQLKMMNANPQLAIPECYFVRSVGGNSLLYDVTDSLSLEQIIQNRRIDWNGFLQLMKRVLAIVWVGEGHMLFKEQYAISEETIFFKSLHKDGKKVDFNEITIIYFPKLLNREYDFAEKLSAFSKRVSSAIICPKEQKSHLLELVETLGNRPDRLLRELVFMEEEIKAEEERLVLNEESVQKENKGKRGRKGIKNKSDTGDKKDSDHGSGLMEYRDKPAAESGDCSAAIYRVRRFLNAWKIPFLSFAVFMSAFWTNLLNITELAGFGLVLLGFNVFMMRSTSEENGDEL